MIGYFDQCSIISGLVSTRVLHVEQMEHETFALRGKKMYNARKLKVSCSRKYCVLNTSGQKQMIVTQKIPLSLSHIIYFSLR